MTVVISLLRGVNLGNRRMKMDALKALYESLGLLDVQTYVQSGNVVFRTRARGLGPLAKRIEDGIEQTFGFRSDVVLRTTADLREVIARSPFAARPEIHPGKLLVTFLANDPGDDAREKVRGIKVHPEELHLDGREHYIYFPDGMGRSKLPAALIERTLKTTGTGRNWNTVTKLLEIAEKLEAV